MIGCGVFLQLAAGNMVIGEQQAVGADKRARSTIVEPDAGKAQMIKPGRVGVKLYLALRSFKGGLSKVHMPSSA